MPTSPGRMCSSNPAPHALLSPSPLHPSVRPGVQDFVDIIGNADSWAVLSWVGGLGVIAVTLLYFVQWIPVPEGDDSWVGKKVGKVPLMWPAEVIKAGCHQMGCARDPAI